MSLECLELSILKWQIPCGDISLLKMQVDLALSRCMNSYHEYQIVMSEISQNPKGITRSMLRPRFYLVHISVMADVLERRNKLQILHHSHPPKYSSLHVNVNLIVVVTLVGSVNR